jgi:L-seryl-tRNA(Ser) seleniumtransferase
MGQSLLPKLETAIGKDFHLSLQESTAQIGSGALPTEELPTVVITISHAKLSANAIAKWFRQAHPPIIGRVKDDRFLLDLRTIFNPDDLIPNFRSE